MPASVKEVSPAGKFHDIILPELRDAGVWRHGVGTEPDGTWSADYCSRCYQKGLTEPRITMDQMIERVAARMRAMSFPEKMIALNAKLLPTLKRWTQPAG